MDKVIFNFRKLSFFFVRNGLDKKKLVCLLVASFSLVVKFPLSANAQVHRGLSFQASIKNHFGVRPTVNGATAKVQILTPTNDCVLREEIHTNISLIDGYFSLVIGGPTAMAAGGFNPFPVLNINQALNNAAPLSGLSCINSDNSLLMTNQTYTFNNYSRRKIRIRLTIPGEAQEVVADFNMRSVAYAVNAETLNGKTEAEFITVNNSQNLTQANVQSVFNRFTKLDAILQNLNANGTVPINQLEINNNGNTYLAGDGTWKAISGTGSVTSVASRTGDIVLTSNDITDASSLSTGGTIVKRDGLGGFAAGNVTFGNVTSTGLNSTGNISGTSVSASATVTGSTISGGIGQFSTLKIYDGVSGFLTQIAPSGGFGSGYTIEWPSGVGTNNQILAIASVVGNTASLEWSTPGSGSVTSVTSANSDISVATTTTTPVLTLNSGVTGGAGDANKIAKLDASGLLTPAMVPLLEASKIATGTLPVAIGGTNSTTALVNNRIMASSGGAIVEAAAITANRALVSNASGIPTHSTVTDTELGYLSGVTSAVQTQINGKASSSGWTNFSVMGVNGTGNLVAIPGTTGNTMLQWTAAGPDWSSATYPASTTVNQLLYSSAANVVSGLATVNNATLVTNASGVPSWEARTTDHYTQYALLAGRAGGQTLAGGTAASENLTLQSTTNATKGNIILNPNGGNVGIGTTTPSATLDIGNNGGIHLTPGLAPGVTTDKLYNVGSTLYWNGAAVGSGSGTVSSVSVASANGFSGTVATSTTTPAITLSTTVTGMLKGNGTALSAATAGTDYSAGTSALATGVLKSTTSTGALSIAGATDLNSTFGSQTANTFYAAPNGSAGTPSFRALATADIPDAAVTNIKMATMAAGTIKANTTGASAAPSDVTIASLQGTTASTFAAGNDARITNALQKTGDTMTGTLTLATGTTTLPPLKIPSGALLTTPASGNIESNGTNLYWTNSTPTREKVATYPEAVTPANGQLMIGNGTGFSLATITAGSGVSVTNSAGGITIAATGSGGSVTSVTSANSDISVATTTTTPVLTLNSGTTGGAGDANKIAKLDASGLLTPAMVPSLEASKIATGTLPVAIGGTNSTTALVNNRIMASSGGAIVEAAAITANRALVSNASGIPTHSTVTDTELGYLSGVTSAVQTQINGKASSSGWTNFSVMGVNGTGNLVAIPGTTGNTMLQWTAAGPDWSLATYPASTTVNQLLYSSAANVVSGLATVNNATLVTNASGVPSWEARTTDHYSQYALLAGRAGGQTLAGGTAASENLTLQSTTNATKGNVVLNPNGGNVGIGTTTPGAPLDVRGAIRMSLGSGGYTGFQPSALSGSTVWTLPPSDGSNGQVLTTDGVGGLSWSSHPSSFNDSQLSYSQSRTANTFLAAPNGSAGAASFRAIASADLPAGGYDSTYLKNGGNSFTATATIGTNDAQNLSFETNNVTKVTIDTFGNVGLGMTPSYALDVGRNDGSLAMRVLNGSSTAARFPTVAIVNYTGTFAGYPQLYMANLRGATGVGSALPSVSGDILGRIATVGSLDTSGTAGLGALIHFTAAGNFSATSSPGQIQFYTTPVGSLSAQERVRLDSDGNLGIGTVPTKDLEVSRADKDSTLQIINRSSTSPRSPQISIVNYTGSASGNGSNLNLVASRGASGGTLPVQSGDLLGSIYTYGTTDTSNNANAAAAIKFTAAGNFSTTSTPGDIHFYTVPSGSASMSERLTILSSGNIGIGLSNPTYQLQLSTDSAAKPGTSTWTVASDKRLKDIHGDFKRGLNEILNLKIVYFTYKKDNEENLPSDKEYVGVIAQEVKKVIPEAVSQDEKGFFHVTNDSIIWAAVNAIKELYGKWYKLNQSLQELKFQLQEKADRSELKDAQLKIQDLERENKKKDVLIRSLEQRLEKIEKSHQLPKD